MTRANHVCSWDMVMRSLVTLNDPMPKKVIKSKGVVFLEDQTLQGLEQDDITYSAPNISATKDPDLEILLLVIQDYMGDVQDGYDGVIDDLPIPSIHVEDTQSISTTRGRGQNVS